MEIDDLDFSQDEMIFIGKDSKMNMDFEEERDFLDGINFIIEDEE